VDPLLSYAQVRQGEIIALIRRFVECESPSDTPEALDRFVELVSDTVAPFAQVKTVKGGRSGKHLMVQPALPGKRKQGQILALGHGDTVWPMGTRFLSSPCRRCATSIFR
jgi:glutamate carboxypeptidase